MPPVDTTVDVTRVGSGTPLVLLHGIAHRRQAWDPVLDELAKHHEVIAIDIPGFGRTPLPPDGFPRSFAQVVEMMSGVFEDLGLEKPHVAGNSMGGGIALELARAGRVASATALSPAGFAEMADGRHALIALLRSRATTYMPERLIASFLRSPRGRAYALRVIVEHPENISPERALGDALAMRRGKGFFPALRALRSYWFEGTMPADVPVTIAWGTRDRLLLPHQAAVAAKRLPDAHHVSLPDCGHVPMSDDPALVASVILETTGAREVAPTADAAH